MEKTLTAPKLALNKKVISKLQNYRPVRLPQNVYTENCTFPECASEPLCRTIQDQSCAPCLPDTRNPGGTTGRN